MTVAGQISSFHLLHHSNFPESSFIIGVPSQTDGSKPSPRATSDQGFDLILGKFSAGLVPEYQTKFELIGNEYFLKDFRVRVGTVSLGSASVVKVVLNFFIWRRIIDRKFWMQLIVGGDRWIWICAVLRCLSMSCSSAGCYRDFLPRANATETRNITTTNAAGGQLHGGWHVIPISRHFFVDEEESINLNTYFWINAHLSVYFTVVDLYLMFLVCSMNKNFYSI